MNVYAVTGEIHGLIISAKKRRKAKRIFRRSYPGEKILFVIKRPSYYLFL